MTRCVTRLRWTHDHGGQAMTEFLIAASFVLIPLFLIVPMLSKYIDIKHATIQAARYEAWEYTVWSARDCERDTANIAAMLVGTPQECRMGGFEPSGFSTFPVKSTADTRNEARQRFFSRINDADPGDPDDGVLAITAQDKQGWDNADRNMFWTARYGGATTPLYNDLTATTGDENLTSSSDTPSIPVIGDVMDVLIDVIALVFGALGDLLGVLGSSVGFDAINTDGFATATVTANVADLPQFVSAPGLGRDANVANVDLVFKASAGVLTDGWNAGGREHTYNQAGGTVPTVLLKELLNLPGLSEIWTVIGVMAPELRRCNQINYLNIPWDPNDKGSLWFGHIDIDAAHPDRLGDQTGTHSCDDAGRCDLQFTTVREERDCIP